MLFEVTPSRECEPDVLREFDARTCQDIAKLAWTGGMAIVAALLITVTAILIHA